MAAIFSKTCEYGLQALIYMAGGQSASLCSQKEIAESLKVPHHFLGKILQNLVGAGLAVSVKGKNGGFGLAKPPKQIKLIDIVHALEGPGFLESCFLGLPGCGGDNPCAAHKQWASIKGRILVLMNKNLHQLHKGLDEKLDL